MIYGLPGEQVQTFSFLLWDVMYNYSSDSRSKLLRYKAKYRTIKRVLA